MTWAWKICSYCRPGLNGTGIIYKTSIFLPSYPQSYLHNLPSNPIKHQTGRPVENPPGPSMKVTGNGQSGEVREERNHDKGGFEALRDAGAAVVSRLVQERQGKECLSPVSANKMQSNNK